MVTTTRLHKKNLTNAVSKSHPQNKVRMAHIIVAMLIVQLHLLSYIPDITIIAMVFGI